MNASYINLGGGVAEARGLISTFWTFYEILLHQYDARVNFLEVAGIDLENESSQMRVVIENCIRQLCRCIRLLESLYMHNVPGYNRVRFYIIDENGETASSEDEDAAGS
jgi:hypothetical protein